MLKKLLCVVKYWWIDFQYQSERAEAVVSKLGGIKIAGSQVEQAPGSHVLMFVRRSNPDRSEAILGLVVPVCISNKKRVKQTC